MAVDILKQMKTNGCNVTTLVMDGDSVTINRVRSEFNSSMKKKLDENHLKKGIIGHLYKLSCQHSVLKKTVRNYITRSIMYAIKQNYGRPNDIALNLKAVVPHLFGNHKSCNTTWCHHARKGSDFTYRSLPKGKPLHGDSLQADLTTLLDRYIKQADMLTSLGSTQACESMNSMVAAKAPKARFYGGSESLNCRVSCAVAQKNIGYKYMSKNLQNMKKRKLQHQRESSREEKKKRLIRKNEYATVEAASAVCEGDTYGPAIALKEEVDLASVKLPHAEANSDLVFFDTETTGLGDTYGPAIALKEEVDLASVKLPHAEANSDLVFFDTETTGLESHAEIVQIAAVCGQEEFNKYIMPFKDIRREATEATGLSVRNNRLYLRDTEVDTTSPHSAMVSFLEFLQERNSPVLVGHNICRFDTRILVHSLQKCKMLSAVSSVVVGCVDTLPVSRKKLPRSPSYRQEDLVQHALGKSVDAHNALGDVKALQELYNARLELTPNELDASIFDLRHSLHKVSLQPLVEAKALSVNMQSRFGKEGLGLNNTLRLAHSRDPDSGLWNLVSSRVTKSKSVIHKILEYFSEPVQV